MRAAGIVLAVWLAGLGAAAQFGKVSVAWDLMAQHYGGVSPVALGLLVSVVGLVGLVFGTTAGLIVARLGARRVMAGALALGALASALQSGLPGYGAMMALRVAEGVSHLAIVVAGPVIIAGVSAGRHQGLAMTLWSSFFGVTYAVLALVAPLAGSVAGLFWGHAVWMAVCAVLCLWIVPRDGAREVGPFGGLLAQHRAIYASPRVAAPALGFVFYTMAYVALLTLVPPLFSPGLRGVAATGMPLVSIALSLSLGVWALRRMAAVRLVQAGFAAGASGVVLFALGLVLGEGLMLAGALGVAGALGLVQGASFAAIPQLNPDPGDRARAAGALAQMGNVGTVTGTPILAALMAGAGGWGVVAFALPLCLAGMAMHAWLARRRRADRV
ncbi:MAG: MFS transporter [Paracoccaceae bacterium]|nr:MAG: MFS transporter [Paracoccaceae bacterium]